MGHVDTAEALASSGFVVVAPMHRGDNFQDDSIVGRPQWMPSRSQDVSSAIDYMLQHWSGRAQLKSSRVGVFGFSAGATAALVSAGGVLDFARLAPHCAARREFVCNIVPPQADAAAPPHAKPDSRIAAVVVAAPGLGFLFEPRGLAGVRVPVQLWAGSHDEVVPYETNAAVVRRLLPNRAEFHSVDGAVHLSFLAPCTAETPPVLCRDREGFDRSAFHRSFNETVTAFFRRHLVAAAPRAAGGQ
jgi:predicted dienelactone hydrolase